MSAPSTRTQALSLTWAIVRTAKLPFVSAQAKAWATLKLKAQLRRGPVSFSYVKDDGSVRHAIGELTTEGAGGKPAGPLVVRYYDTLARGWRSFRADRLITA